MTVSMTMEEWRALEAELHEKDLTIRELEEHNKLLRARILTVCEAYGQDTRFAKERITKLEKTLTSFYECNSWTEEFQILYKEALEC